MSDSTDAATVTRETLLQSAVSFFKLAIERVREREVEN